MLSYKHILVTLLIVMLYDCVAGAIYICTFSQKKKKNSVPTENVYNNKQKIFRKIWSKNNHTKTIYFIKLITRAGTKLTKKSYITSNN